MQDRDTKVFFDFGESFTWGSDFFVDWLVPRSVVGLKDYFESDLVPKLKGLYSEDAVRFTDPKHQKPLFARGRKPAPLNSCMYEFPI